METAKDISISIAPYIGQSGTCPDEFGELLAAINTIRTLLWNKVDYTNILEWLDICCVKSCFYLPARYETIRYAKMCGIPLTIQNEWFQITRPDARGIHIYDSLPETNVVEDVGNPNCKFREYNTAPYILEAYSESNLDEGVELQVNVRNANGRWSKQILTLKTAFDKVSLEQEIVTFIEFSKPQTAGGVRLFAHDVTNNLRMQLGIYQPWEVNPSYKRYTAPGYGPNVIKVKAKLKRFDLKGEHDLVEFPIDAMILAAQAITYRLDKDTQNYQGHLALAVGELQQEMLSNETRGSTPLKFHVPIHNASLIGGFDGCY